MHNLEFLHLIQLPERQDRVIDAILQIAVVKWSFLDSAELVHLRLRCGDWLKQVSIRHEFADFELLRI